MPSTLTVLAAATTATSVHFKTITSPIHVYDSKHYDEHGTVSWDDIKIPGPQWDA